MEAYYYHIKIKIIIQEKAGEKPPTVGFTLPGIIQLLARTFSIVRLEPR
jgi:hypothetical protein